jgi:hypothetical protein
VRETKRGLVLEVLYRQVITKSIKGVFSDGSFVGVKEPKQDYFKDILPRVDM